MKRAWWKTFKHLLVPLQIQGGWLKKCELLQSYLELKKAWWEAFEILTDPSRAS